MSRKKRLRPFFSFFGSKWRIAPKYPDPKNWLIVEPFAGSASYSLLHYDRAVLLQDADPVVVGVWDYLINTSESEILRLPLLEEGQSVDSLSVVQEAKWLIGFWCNKGGTRPAKTLSSWGRDPRHASQFWGEAIRQRVASQVGHIRHWEVRLAHYSASPGVEATWFVDPPYEVMGRHYKAGADSIDFSHLGAWCRNLKGQVMVCENTGARWLPFEHLVNAKANESKSGGRVSREALWVSG